MSDGPRPSLVDIFGAFFKVGFTAYGGGSATVMAIRRTCLRRKWLTEGEFFDSLLLSRLTPGVTILAQVLLIGKRLRGHLGATTAMAGLMAPAVCVTVAIARLYDVVSTAPIAARPLSFLGAVAAGFALGLTAKMTLETFKRLRRLTGPLLFLGYLGLSLLARNAFVVLGVAAVIGVAIPALFRGRTAPDEP